MNRPLAYVARLSRPPFLAVLGGLIRTGTFHHTFLYPYLFKQYFHFLYTHYIVLKDIEG